MFELTTVNNIEYAANEACPERKDNLKGIPFREYAQTVNFMVTLGPRVTIKFT